MLNSVLIDRATSMIWSLSGLLTNDVKHIIVKLSIQLPVKIKPGNSFLFCFCGNKIKTEPISIKISDPLQHFFPDGYKYYKFKEKISYNYIPDVCVISEKIRYVCGEQSQIWEYTNITESQKPPNDIIFEKNSILCEKCNHFWIKSSATSEKTPNKNMLKEKIFCFCKLYVDDFPCCECLKNKQNLLCSVPNCGNIIYNSNKTSKCIPCRNIIIPNGRGYTQCPFTSELCQCTYCSRWSHAPHLIAVGQCNCSLSICNIIS
jgi:hypothetical protein